MNDILSVCEHSLNSLYTDRWLEHSTLTSIIEFSWNFHYLIFLTLKDCEAYLSWNDIVCVLIEITTTLMD